MVRIFGGVMVCLLYLFYYDGGDTTNYYKGSICMLNLMFKNFPVYLDIMKGNLSFENYMAFDTHTGYPPTYMYKDEKTFARDQVYKSPCAIMHAIFCAGYYRAGRFGLFRSMEVVSNVLQGISGIVQATCMGHSFCAVCIFLGIGDFKRHIYVFCGVLVYFFLL